MTALTLPRPRSLRRTVSALALLAFSGCDIPSGLPIVDQTWIVALTPTVLDQREFLPSAITIEDDVYRIAIEPLGIAVSYGGLCPICPNVVDSLTVTVPAFSTELNDAARLPRQIVSIDVAGGGITFGIYNNLGFDPLEGGGRVRFELEDAGGVPIFDYELNWPSDSLPTGTVTQRFIPIEPTTITDEVILSTLIEGAGGQVFTLLPDDAFGVDITLDSLRIGSVVLDIHGTEVTFDQQSVDVGDIDPTVVDAIRSGLLSIEVRNSFGVGFQGTASVGPVAKSFSLSPDPTDQVDVEYERDELRSIVDTSAPIFIGSGTIVGGPAVISPSSTLSLRPVLHFNVEWGS